MLMHNVKWWWMMMMMKVYCTFKKKKKHRKEKGVNGKRVERQNNQRSCGSQLSLWRGQSLFWQARQQ